MHNIMDMISIVAAFVAMIALFVSIAAQLSKKHYAEGDNTVEEDHEIQINLSKYSWANVRQMEYILDGYIEGFTEEQIDVYARPEYTPGQMRLAVKALSAGLSSEDVRRLLHQAEEKITANTDEPMED